MLNFALDSHLRAMGFIQSDHDPCLYVSGEDDIIIAVYVDDVILAGSKTDWESQEEAIIEVWQDLGELKYFLGMTVIQDG